MARLINDWSPGLDRRQLLKISACSTMFASLGASAQVGQTVALEKTSGLPAWPSKVQKVIFGSCIDQNKPQPIWQPILAAKPDLFIFGGDNVYASRQPWQLQNLNNAYAAQAAQPGFAALRTSVPHVAIWDDHDMGLNDGGIEFPHKQEAKNAFIDFWQLPVDDPRRTREGLYHAHVFGPVGQRVQIILLDTRWFRSKLRVTDQRDAPGKERYVPDSDPQKTMLGGAQWQWLEAQLTQPAEVRLIVSGVQVIVEGHGWEGWGNFPGEQDKLKQLIVKTGAKGVVLLSGDRHIGAIYKSSGTLGYPLYEITSSGMTHAWANAKEDGPNRLGELITQNHFGLIEMNWSKQEVQLGFQNTQGEWLQKQTIALSELR
jgi:alkaline phosphatase D